MKRIVLCLDGTWNKVAKPDEVTNVVKFAQSILANGPDGVQQVVYYNSGVGTGGPIDRFLGGVFGLGIKSNVQRAYSFLTLNYAEGDEIYIVGFSRGAYTARALASIVNAVGVLRREEFERFEDAWEYYRVPPKVRKAARLQRQAEPVDDPEAAKAAAKATSKQKEVVKKIEDKRQEWFRRAKVKALGVWDTVGSYGVPAGLAPSGVFFNFAEHFLGFHDRQLGNNIENAFHAVAIDETRAPFEPTFWTRAEGEPPPKGHVEQVWFPGVHSDVGGGYKETGLSDLALVWMLDRMVGAGLAVDAGFVRNNVDPCPRCGMHQSDTKWWQFLNPYQRPLFGDRKPIRGRDGRVETVLNERVHWGVLERLEKGGLFRGKIEPYKPPNVRQPIPADRLASPGEFEVRILKEQRDHPPPHPWAGHHTECWSAGLPQGWPKDRLATPAGPLG